MQMRQYFKGELKDKYKGLGALMTSLGLNYLEVEEFEKEFGCTTKEEIVQFIMNSENAYRIGRWSDQMRNPIRPRTGFYSSKGKVKGDDGGRF